jgi:hypothetical protein
MLTDIQANFEQLEKLKKGATTKARESGIRFMLLSA